MRLNRQQTDGWRDDKDSEKIAAEVDSSYPYQVAFCQKLESLYPNHRFQYPKSRAEESGSAFDLIVDDVFKVELECGTTQKEWKRKLPPPSRWPRGLSIPTRKFKEGRWDIYIKFNMDLDSFFAINWNYLKELDSKLTYKENVDHSLQYKTNNNFVSVNKPYVKKKPPDMTFDDWRQLEQMFEKESQPS